MTEPTFSDSWPILYVHEVHPADQYREADQEEIVRHPEFDDLRKENALLRAEVADLRRLGDALVASLDDEGHVAGPDSVTGCPICAAVRAWTAAHPLPPEKP
jgi:hypothetical protein